MAISFCCVFLSFYLYYIEIAGEQQIPILISSEEDDGDIIMKRDILPVLKQNGINIPAEGVVVRLDPSRNMVLSFFKLDEKEENWYAEVNELGGKIEKIEKIGNIVVLNVFFKCPIPLAISLGASINVSKPIVLWHYEPSKKGNYVRVIDLTFNRRQKLRRPIQAEEQNALKHIKVSVKRNEGSRTVAISIYLASHKPKIDKYDGDIIEVKSATPCYISPAEDWLEIVNEIYNVIMNEVNSGKEVDVYASMPLPIAFALGMALGNKSPVRLYHWFQDKQMY
jgi:hypothetical protein